MQQQIFTEHPFCTRAYVGHWGSKTSKTLLPPSKGQLDYGVSNVLSCSDILLTQIATISMDDGSRLFDPTQRVLDLLEPRHRVLSYI